VPKLLNPFQPPLLQLIESVTPSNWEKTNAQHAFTAIEKYLLAHPQEFPLAQPDILKLVGSHWRETDLSPVQHIDVFALFAATSFSEQDPPSPSKTVEGIATLLSKDFVTKLSGTKQAVKIQLKEPNFEIRITPAFVQSGFYYIPEEKSETAWKKVSPDKEKELIMELDAKLNKLLIPTIRCMKFWNDGRNNGGFRNYHIEAIAFHIFSGIPTVPKNVFAAVQIYVEQMSKLIFDCPDPTGLSTPIHKYLPDNIDQWYLFMNRVSDLKTAIKGGEKALKSWLLDL
jgi:hypothetical protein